MSEFLRRKKKTELQAVLNLLTRNLNIKFSEKYQNS